MSNEDDSGLTDEAFAEMERIFEERLASSDDDAFADTVELVGTKEVSRLYSDETHQTMWLRYTVDDPYMNEEVSYDINAVRIGCRSCRQNTTAIIRPDGMYECLCGRTNELNRATMFYQQKMVTDVWEY